LAVSGTDLYVGGAFTTAYNSGAVSVSANYVARWDGASWSALGTGSGPSGNGLNSYVNALAVTTGFLGEVVYVGGAFATAYNSGASSVAANHLAFWSLGIWWTLGSGGGNGVGGPVYALAVGGGSLYVG